MDRGDFRTAPATPGLCISANMRFGKEIQYLCRPEDRGSVSYNGLMN